MSKKEKRYRKIAAVLLKNRFDPNGLISRRFGGNCSTIADVLFEWSQSKPYFHLEGYMLRWWVLRHPQRPDDKDYKDTTFAKMRNGLRYLYPFYARFHMILRKDNGDPHHNHPFGFTSIILKGWYEEEVLNPDGSITTIRYNPGDVNIKSPDSYHRITRVSPECVLTLVIMGPRTGSSWGFKVNGQHIHFKKFLNIK